MIRPEQSGLSLLPLARINMQGFIVAMVLQTAILQ